MTLSAHTPDVPVPPARGARRFLVKLACFAALQLGALAIVEYRLAKIPNAYNLKTARLDAGDPSVEVLVVGSSHVLNGLNPDEMNLSAVNLAGYSQDLYYDAQLVRHYLNKVPSLKCVVIGLSYFTLEYDMEETAEAWRSCYYRHYFGIPHRHAWLELLPGNFCLAFQYGPTLTRQLLLDENAQDITGYVQANGWAGNPVPEKPEENVRDGEQRLAAHHQLMQPENAAKNLAILDELIVELRARDIKVVLVTTPVYETYAVHCEPERLARWQAAVRHLATAQGVVHFNYMNDVRFEVADFYNSDHLNRNGAAKFSRLFGQELELACRESGTRLARLHEDHPPVQNSGDGIKLR